MPRVSITMPVYNGEQYVRYAIDSILAQIYTDYEIIIVDDGSTDNTFNIVDSYSANEGLHIIRNENNQGLSYSRNLAVKHATGEYIALLDSDDVAMPTWLNKFVTFMDNNREYGLVSAYSEIIDERGTKTGERYSGNNDPYYIMAHLLFHNSIVNSSTLIRRTALPETLYRAECAPADDWDMVSRISVKHKICKYPEYLIQYRVHQTNISKQTDILERGCRNVAKWHIENMGIKADDDNISMHRIISKKEYSDSTKISIKMLEWLVTLSEQNRVYKVYPQIILDTYLAERAVSILKNTYKYDMAMLFKYALSSLSPKYNMPFALWFKVILKSIIRWEKKAVNIKTDPTI